MNNKNQYINTMHFTRYSFICLLTLTSIAQGLQEKEATTTTVTLPYDSSTSSEEMHSSSESFSSEEINTNDTITTTPISINSSRIDRQIHHDMHSSSDSSSVESTSFEQMYSSTEIFTVTVPSVNETSDNDTIVTTTTTTTTGISESVTTEAITTTTTPMVTINSSSSESDVTSISSPINETTGQMLPLKQATSECEEHHLKSDKCLQDALFVGQTSAVIPKSEDEMDAYCIVKKQDFNCIKEYGTKCLKNVPRQIYLTITKNVRKMFKEFCDTSSGKKTFLKHLECAKPEHLKILNEVLGRLTLSLDYVANNVSRDEMIFHACCTLQDTYKKIPIVMGDMCTPKETPMATIDFFRSLIRRTVGDIVDIGCGKYSSLQYCEENLSNGMKELRNYANDANRPLPSMSFMSPLMLFAQKLDGQQ